MFETWVKYNLSRLDKVTYNTAAKMTIFRNVYFDELVKLYTISLPPFKARDLVKFNAEVPEDDYAYTHDKCTVRLKRKLSATKWEVECIQCKNQKPFDGYCPTGCRKTKDHVTTYRECKSKRNGACGKWIDVAEKHLEQFVKGSICGAFDPFSSGELVYEICAGLTMEVHYDRLADQQETMNFTKDEFVEWLLNTQTGKSFEKDYFQHAYFRQWTVDVVKDCCDALRPEMNVERPLIDKLVAKKWLERKLNNLKNARCEATEMWGSMQELRSDLVSVFGTTTKATCFVLKFCAEYVIFDDVETRPFADFIEDKPISEDSLGAVTDAVVKELFDQFKKELTESDANTVILERLKKCLTVKEYDHYRQIVCAKIMSEFG